MGAVRLSDLIVVPQFASRVIDLSTQKNKLFNSGVIASEPRISNLVKGEGATFTLPHWNDIAGVDNVSSDDPATSATPGNITTGSQIAVKMFRNITYGSMDLNKSFEGGIDPLEVIAGLLADNWVRNQQGALIKIFDGVIASNVSANSGDMVFNIATDANSAVTSGEKISATAILAAKQTMGDAADALSTLIMHSVVYTELQKQNLIAFIPNDQANVGFGTYMGYGIIIDDNVPAVAGTYRITYTTYLVGRGVIGYGEGTPKVPSEYFRTPLTGNGGGQETLISRREFIMHPMGIKWNSASMAGSSPTNAELAITANWTRVLPRKKIPFVAIKTNG